MEKLENTLYMGEFRSRRVEKAMNAIIKRRNSYGWKLLNTNVKMLRNV